MTGSTATPAAAVDPVTLTSQVYAQALGRQDVTPYGTPSFVKPDEVETLRGKGLVTLDLAPILGQSVNVPMLTLAGPDGAQILYTLDPVTGNYVPDPSNQILFGKQ